jgi:hypothetical protein
VPEVFVKERLAGDFRAARKPAARADVVRVIDFAVDHRRDIACGMAALAAASAIAVNSLFLQTGPHPAPIFAIRPLPVVFREATGAVTLPPPPRPVELRKQAQRPEVIPLPRPRAQMAAAGSRADPIGDMIDPTRSLNTVQKILNEFGYGPVKVNGALDTDTREGIRRFERDHNLPVTGQNSPKLRHALSLATGRSLD